MNGEQRLRSALRFSIAALCGVVIMAAALGLLLTGLLPETPLPDPTGSARCVAQAGAILTGADTDGSAAPDGTCRVTLTYAASAGGNSSSVTVNAVSAEQIVNLAPQNTAGWRFYWLLDGELWDGTVTDGMSLNGRWVPVYEVTVY